MAPTHTKSEHWLTLMCCSDCKQTPDESPVYICSLGHTICLNCFKQLTRNGVPKCSSCGSAKFTAKSVSSDFLKKLKTRPGIGRPYRYGRVDPSIATPTESSVELQNKDNSVTMEKLFKMPTDDLRKFFDETSRRRTKLTSLHSQNPSMVEPHRNMLQTRTVIRPWSGQRASLHNIPNRSGRGRLVKQAQSVSSVMTSRSKKPLTCPHGHCNKIIAFSSFLLHFKHEHHDIQKIQVLRGECLQVNLNAHGFEFNTTVCLALITVHEKSEMSNQKNTNPHGHSANVAKKFPDKVELGTFWLMMSSSPDTRRTHSYVIFWLFTSDDHDLPPMMNCTLEIASEGDEMAFSAFCAVNILPEDMSIKAIGSKLHCLYVTYGGLESILTYGPKPIFRITVH